MGGHTNSEDDRENLRLLPSWRCCGFFLLLVCVVVGERLKRRFQGTRSLFLPNWGGPCLHCGIPFGGKTCLGFRDLSWRRGGSQARAGWRDREKAEEETK